MVGPKEKEEKGITCRSNSCYFTVNIHKIPSMTKKVIRNFGALNLFFSLKKSFGNFVRQNVFFVPPKLNAKSPTMPAKLKLLLFISIGLIQCSKWTGTHRNGVPVREMDRCNRSVSSRYARTHQNAVPVRHFSIIITYSTMKSVAD